MVNKIFNQNDPFSPTVKKTPTGGIKIAKMILIMLMTVIFYLTRFDLRLNH